MTVDPNSDTPDRTSGVNAGATRLFLVRHGRTSLNAAGVLRGRLDPPLDSHGRRQVKDLGATLAGRGIRLVVSSPLRRTVETARAIAVAADVDIELDPRLVDRDYGEWAGKPKQAAEAAYGSIDRAPGVEPANDVQARAVQSLTDLARRVPGQTAVAVTHDVVLRLALIALDPNIGDPERLTQKTACFNTLDYLDDEWTVVNLNERSNHPEGRRHT